MADDARRDELIGAALAGDITVDEARELDELIGDDADLRAEIDDLRATARQLSASDVRWQEPVPDPALGDRIETAIGVETGKVVPIGRTRWSRPIGLLVAAALVAVGALGSVITQQWADRAPSGPPGTLGAVEDITFRGEPARTSIDGAVIAHTWGTETDLVVDGLDVGETFRVVLVDSEGQELSAGSFLGAQEKVTCRMNAAVMRDDVEVVQIQDADGDVVASASLPSVA